MGAMKNGAAAAKWTDSVDAKAGNELESAIGHASGKGSIQRLLGNTHDEDKSTEITGAFGRTLHNHFWMWSH
jgi:hypothetical protein